jgi:hypothetical protein
MITGLTHSSYGPFSLLLINSVGYSNVLHIV